MRTHIPGGKYLKIISHETKRYGGLNYSRVGNAFALSKGEAYDTAKYIRARGRLARVAKDPDSYGWTVFARKSR